MRSPVKPLKRRQLRCANMDFLLTALHYGLSFFLVISVIVFVHEFGHYIVAKFCGVKIEVFSLGFGKEIVGWTDKSGTRWKLSLLPFGGYVKMFGDAGAASTPDDDKLEHMSEEEKRVSFHYKPLWRKALIVAAGPFFNFLLTIAVFTYFVYNVGLASTEPVVGEVMPDTPAAEAGFETGDRVLRIDGKEIHVFGDISNAIATNIGAPIHLEIQRGEEQLSLTLTPMRYADEDGLGNQVERPLIGLKSTRVTYEDVSLPEALGEATNRTWRICVMSLQVVGQMITGQRSAQELKGPVGIAQLSGQVTQSGDNFSETLHMILWFIALLSANLGMINLFPIPMLDGGHLLYYAIEAVRGRPMAERFQEYGFRFGMAVILSLMAFTLYNDFRQLVLQ